jgi:hypothetical protein
MTENDRQPPDEVALYATLEQAHRQLDRIKRGRPHRAAGRGFSLVATKLDEARLWLDEALAIADEPETASGDRP